MKSILGASHSFLPFSLLLHIYVPRRAAFDVPCTVLLHWHAGLNPHYGEWGRVFERPRSNRSTSASSEEANSTKGIEKWGSWMNIMDGTQRTPIPLK